MDVGIFALIKNKQDKILLVRDATRQQLWTLPGGGLFPSELVTDTLAREVKEETSLTVEPVKLLGIFSQTKSEGIVILFEAIILEGEAKPDGVETSECKYFSRKDLEETSDQVKPAQYSMIWQVSNSKTFPIFNNFAQPK